MLFSSKYDELALYLGSATITAYTTKSRVEIPIDVVHIMVGSRVYIDEDITIDSWACIKERARGFLSVMDYSKGLEN